VDIVLFLASYATKNELVAAMEAARRTGHTESAQALEEFIASKK
jgi:hypothetical protein